MVSFTKDESRIVYEFPQSDASFGIDECIWEQLKSAEKVYLKLLDEESDFISPSPIGEPESEPGDLFGFESNCRPFAESGWSTGTATLSE